MLAMALHRGLVFSFPKYISLFCFSFASVWGNRHLHLMEFNFFSLVLTMQSVPDHPWFSCCSPVVLPWSRSPACPQRVAAPRTPHLAPRCHWFCPVTDWRFHLPTCLQPSHLLVRPGLQWVQSRAGGAAAATACFRLEKGSLLNKISFKLHPGVQSVWTHANLWYKHLFYFFLFVLFSN